MPAKLPAIFNDEDAARAFLESKRWPDGAFCPRCECAGNYELTPRPTSKNPVRSGVHKCKACRGQFTVRIGTMFEESKIPLSKWLMAVRLMTNDAKGASAQEIANACGLTVKSAWFVARRIRDAMKEPPLADALDGAVKELRRRFGQLAKQWKAETSHWSNMAHRAEHRAYREIMAMGMPAVPLLLAEVKKRPDDWFWALHHLTGADPVPAAHRGDLRRMARAWIKWGISRGYAT